MKAVCEYACCSLFVCNSNGSVFECGLPVRADMTVCPTGESGYVGVSYECE